MANRVMKTPKLFGDRPEIVCYAVRIPLPPTLIKGDAYDEDSRHHGGITLCPRPLCRAICPVVSVSQPRRFPAGKAGTMLQTPWRHWR